MCSRPPFKSRALVSLEATEETPIDNRYPREETPIEETVTIQTLEETVALPLIRYPDCIAPRYFPLRMLFEFSPVLFIEFRCSNNKWFRPHDPESRLSSAHTPELAASTQIWRPTCGPSLHKLSPNSEAIVASNDNNGCEIEPVRRRHHFSGEVNGQASPQRPTTGRKRSCIVCAVASSTCEARPTSPFYRAEP